MDTPLGTATDQPHQFPVALSGHAVWLDFRFWLRLRDVEALRCDRGVIGTEEAIRQWCGQFG